MIKRLIITKSTIKKLLFGTSALGAIGIGYGGIAYAQTAQPAPIEIVNQDDGEDEAEEERDVIVVTGSRLRRDEFTSASPLQVIDGELARDLGLVDAADLLGQTTVVQGQQFTTSVSTSAGIQTDSGPGSATASLRGLDPGRTLVLVNGRRLSPAGVRGAPSAPDLNLIPGSMIERVDVLLDGASSVYGSDAVAGVVNYILRDNFDGIQLDAFATMPELPGNAGHQEVLSATMGASNDKGFIGFGIEHSRTDGYDINALSDFYAPYAGGCVSAVTLGASGTIYEPDLCSGSFGAGAVAGGGFLGFSQGANVPGLPPNFVPIAITAGLIQPDNIDGQRLLLFPEELDAAFSPDFKRTSFYTLGEYDTGFYGDMTAYFEASHAIRDTNTNTSGQGRIPLPATYALNPFGRQVTQYFGSRFINDTRVDQTRLIGGIRGDLPFLEKSGFNNWNYDAYISYSRSSGADRIVGIPYNPRLEQTLANTVVDPITGIASCTTRSIPNQAQGVNCRPLDFQDPTFLLTGRFPDEADNDYLFPDRLTDTTVEQTVYSGYLSGDLFDTPWGGTVIAGFGGEFRKDKIATNTSLSGEFLGFASDPGSNGTRSLREVFGELEVPLIRDRPGIHDLTVNFAGRYTDEDNFGSENTYSVKGQYSPVNWLTFRGTYGTSFRAPNLGEQFGGSVTGFPVVTDPCRVPGVTVPFVDHDNDPTTPNVRVYNPTLETRTQTVIQNCLNGGGPFGIPGTDPFSLGVRGLGTSPSPVFLGTPTLSASGSNPNLAAETSEAKSFGVTFDQPWSDDFDLNIAVSYFEITVKDEVDALTANVIINRCYNVAGLTDPTCALLTRDLLDPTDDTTGEVSFVNAILQNLGDQVVEGIDYNAELSFDFATPFSKSPVDYKLIARATQSLTQTEEQITIAGTNIDDDLGESGNPKWRLSLTNQLRWEDFSFLFQSRYIGSQIEDNVPAQRNEAVTTFFSNCVQAGDTPCTQYDGLDDYWVHNASLAFSRGSYVVRVGVNNAFDTPPPLTHNNALNLLGGIGYDLGGRTFFGNVTKRF